MFERGRRRGFTVRKDVFLKRKSKPSFWHFVWLLLVSGGLLSRIICTLSVYVSCEVLNQKVIRNMNAFLTLLSDCKLYNPLYV